MDIAPSVNLEPGAIRFFNSGVRVFEIYMLQFELYFEKRSDVKLGIGITNPTKEFELRDYVFLKDLKNIDTTFNIISLDTLEPLFLIPIGSIVIWAANTIPENWRECNGDLLDIAGYSDLYSLLGYRFTSTNQQNQNIGRPTGEQLFNIPDFRGGLTSVNRLNTSVTVGRRYPDINYNNPLITYINEKKNLIDNFRLKDTQLPLHKHIFTHSDTNKTFIKDHTHTYDRGDGNIRCSVGGYGVTFGNSAAATNNTSLTHTHVFSGIRVNPTPANDTFSIEQQYIVLKYIIRVK
jgi:microcystin-dependent protein